MMIWWRWWWFDYDDDDLMMMVIWWWWSFDDITGRNQLEWGGRGSLEPSPDSLQLPGQARTQQFSSSFPSPDILVLDPWDPRSSGHSHVLPRMDFLLEFRGFVAFSLQFPWRSWWDVIWSTQKIFELWGLLRGAWILEFLGWMSTHKSPETGSKMVVMFL